MTEWKYLSQFKIIERVTPPASVTSIQTSKTNSISTTPSQKSATISTQPKQESNQSITINLNMDSDKLGYIGSTLVLLSVFPTFLSAGLLNLRFSFSLIDLGTMSNYSGTARLSPYIVMIYGLVGLFLTFKKQHENLFYLFLTILLSVISVIIYNHDAPFGMITMGIGFYMLIAGVITLLFASKRLNRPNI